MTEVECKNTNSKRDLFRINNGNNCNVINLEKVTRIELEGNRITFNFSTNGITLEVESDEAAQSVFDKLLKIWGGDVE